MSEPLTSHEIEDVLSSIRRLVSEDLRPARAAMAASQTGRAAPTAGAGHAVADADKLLLTPALRVVPDAESPPPVVPETMPPAGPDLTDRLLSEALLQDADSKDVDASPETAGAAGAPLGLAAEDSDLMQELSAPYALPQDEVYDDVGVDQAGFGSASPFRDVTAADEDVLWAAPGAADTAAPPVDEMDRQATTATSVHGHWTAQDVPGMDWGQDDASWPEVEGVAEPLAFVAHPRKPDLVADPLARAWADRAEQAVRAELGETISTRAMGAAPIDPEPAVKPDPSPGLFDGDESTLDEEMLREIVRDIIREELAGTLGERITRNVRKLVRVEINRALTAREFE